MKNKHNIDEQFKRLANNNDQLPPPDLWEDIEKKLPKPRKNKKYFFFLLMGLTFIGTTCYFAINNISNKDLLSVNTTSSVDEKIALQNDEITVNIVRNNRTSNKVNDEKSAETIEPQTDNKNQHKNIETGLSSEQINLTVDNKVYLIRPKKEDEAIDSEEATNKKAGYTQTVSEVSKAGTKTQKESKNIETVLLIPSGVPEENQQQTTNKQPLKEETSPSLLKLNTIVALVKNEHFISIAKAEKANPTFNSSTKLHPQKKPKKNRLFVDLGGLVGFHNTQVTSTNTRELNYRKNTEKNWYTWGTSLQLGYRLSDKFYVKSGIETLLSRDKFELMQNNVILEDVVDNTVLNYQVTTGTYFNKGDITYRQINIPLTIGCETTLGKLVLGMEATGITNLQYLTEGKIQTGTLTFSKVEDEPIYKKNIGVGLRAAVTVGTKLNQHSSLYLRPTVSKYLNNTNLSTYEVDSELNQYFLELSYRFSF